MYLDRKTGQNDFLTPRARNRKPGPSEFALSARRPDPRLAPRRLAARPTDPGSPRPGPPPGPPREVAQTAAGRSGGGPGGCRVRRPGSLKGSIVRDLINADPESGRD